MLKRRYNENQRIKSIKQNERRLKGRLSAIKRLRLERVRMSFFISVT